ncbi:Alcohol dehydrogenase, class IV [Anaerobium acetethylicum]|uniref:Alcohol dehydrogenase, class IV n=2 Tax=Anaerobium acetethylicum TaxID=1619234 RepID=A0A1D3TW47_9FIRM|nr:Alcohol dehydrogenase, class IV [Anaerobium acetethylicum]
MVTMKKQIIIKDKNYFESIDEILKENNTKRILLVCGNSLEKLKINDYFENLDIPVVRFSDFTPNPSYNSVVEAIHLYNIAKCDFIIAVGGGSAIDIAKCVKLYAEMPASENYLSEIIVPNNIKLLAMPTTAGTGSESTKNAVIYYNGKKQSVAYESCIPDYVILDSTVLQSLPLYQKKATLLDAFCQAIESIWSTDSNDESDEYAGEAIRIIMKHKDNYFNNTESGNEAMLMGANLAGRALNIARTTAPHAMSYKISTRYAIPHGHAVALCLPKIWRYMIYNLHKCIDPRGSGHLESVFIKIAEYMGCQSAEDAVDVFEELMTELDMKAPTIKAESDIEILVKSVDMKRLNNTPVSMDEKNIRNFYTQIFKKSIYS